MGILHVVPAHIDIVAYRSEWPNEFLGVAAEISSVLGDHAITIHHIGSTSVPGLAAKDIIDVQVSVLDIDDPHLRPGLEAAGFVWRGDITRDHTPPGTLPLPEDLEKRYAQRLDSPKVNCHVRVPGRPNHRYALLFRDFLRSSEAAAQAYAEVKRQLAGHFPNDVDAYYDVKDPVMDIIYAAAEGWAATTEWTEPAIPITASDWTLKHRRDRDLFFGHHFASPLPAEARPGFSGLRYFDIEPAWRCEGEFIPIAERLVDVPSTSGVASRYRHVGDASVAIPGHRLRLMVLDDGDGGRFIPFTDETAGVETYGGARYVGIEEHGDGMLTVDFNEAHNPWCVYDDEFVCPLAPPQNAIALRVVAGEQDYRP